MSRPPRAFGIIPAAGHSRRMGRQKLLLPFGKGTILDAVVGAWIASRVDRVVVVVRRDDDEVAKRARDTGAAVTVAQPPPPDMKASIAAGLAWLAAHEAPDSVDAWLVAPADMPLLSAKTINRVLDGHDPERTRIVVPVVDGRRGHPVLFPWGLSGEVVRLGVNEGINRLLAWHAVAELDVDDEAILGDVDTPAAYRRLTERRNDVADPRSPEAG